MSRAITLLTPQVARDGGVAAHVLDAAAALSAAGHDVALVCARSAYAVEDVASVTYVDLADAAALERTLRRRSPEVIHLHDCADPAAVAVARRVAPTVLSAHAYAGCTPNTHYFAPGTECDRHHGPGCIANMALRGCLHARDPRSVPRKYRQASRRLAAYAQADAIVSYSSAVTRHLERNDLAAWQVPLFTPLESLDPDRGDEADDRHVLFVGRVAAEKGLAVLLRALAPIDATLTIAGDGAAMSASRSLAAELGITSRVRFAGWLTGDALVAAYRRATVVAVPSIWPEPFGLVGLEAMAAARPVVASMIGGIVDWLAPDVTGLGVAAGDPHALAAALTRLLADRRRACAMGAAGRRALEADFTAAAHVAALDDVYERALQAWRRARVPLGSRG